ncbi:uncharacterized protein LAESUDRAFT_546903 [Laetiporus sulphureus 93-53]|uniref:Uncharacterized protein n=1 Tax=Laetiporus sulphureus 93-53 TaxID=1314785 RepID=A0A165FPP3_9APHY|nr:uncharacterized protein LAESUDRAFT_546903 [Laetiporus sulphureus 93-53]KZT09287.1 hypothetical protein LAESUDRAFT_546903 [Laetiporus sulphureus 93-53]
MMSSSVDNGSASSTDSETEDTSRTHQRATSSLEESLGFSMFTSAFSVSGKRRGMFGSASNSRDMKSRRRDESSRNPGGGGGGGGGFSSGRMWESGEGPSLRPKDELMDMKVVEDLRAQFGDPFDDSFIENAQEFGKSILSIMVIISVTVRVRMCVIDIIP